MAKLGTPKTSKEKYSSKELADILFEKIQESAQESTENAPYNKIVWGRITGKLGYFHVVNVNGKPYPKTLALTSAGTLAVGDTVVCIVPNNNMSNMFILGKIKK